MKILNKLNSNWKLLITILMINFGLIFCFVIVTLILLNSKSLVVSYVVVLIIINFFTMLLLIIANTTNGLLYFFQIPHQNNSYQPNIKWFWANVIIYLWLTFFITSAFMMFTIVISQQIKPDFYQTIKMTWWPCLLMTFYHAILLVINRYCFVLIKK